MVAETTIATGSSNIAEYGYDPETQELSIQFRNGDSYTYLSVPVSIYQGLQRAQSVGSYFFRHVRERFAFRQE